METFSALLALCAGNSPVPVNSPHKGKWRGALMFTLICARINDWVNNREAGDLRPHRGHYDVNVMYLKCLRLFSTAKSLGTWNVISNGFPLGRMIVWYQSLTWWKILTSFCNAEYPLQWRHNGLDGGSKHVLLNRLFRRRSKKTSKLRVTGPCAGKSPVTGEFPHKWQVTRKMFPFDDVIMYIQCNKVGH